MLPTDGRQGHALGLGARFSGGSRTARRRASTLCRHPNAAGRGRDPRFRGDRLRFPGHRAAGIGALPVGILFWSYLSIPSPVAAATSRTLVGVQQRRRTVQRSRRTAPLRTAPNPFTGHAAVGPPAPGSDILRSSPKHGGHGAVIRVRSPARPFPERALHRHRLRAAARHNVVDEGREAGIAAERHILGQQ